MSLQTYIDSSLEGVPDAPGSDAGVVEISQAGGSPESHLEN